MWLSRRLGSESVLATQGQVITRESKEEGSGSQDDNQAYDKPGHNSDLLLCQLSSIYVLLLKYIIDII